jgi:hypothetical protein
MERGNLSFRGMVNQWLSACGWLDTGEFRAEETARIRVPMRGTGADRLVVVMKVL